MGKNSLLVIEDDQPLCWLLEKVFGDHYDVTIKADSIEAMYWMSNGNIPDIILSDFNMPNFNGIDFLNFLKKSGVFNNIPVVMISGSHDDKLKQECLKFGAVQFVEKPFDPPVLIEIVNETLKKYKDHERV